MMLFQKNADAASIDTFQVSTMSGGRDKPVAFGPASIINGSVMVSLNKPISAYSLRVVFKCEESDSKGPTEIFSVESIIWGQSNKEGQKNVLPSGSHMYLFAIRMPSVNYPPTMFDADYGHKIRYTLQGFIDATHLISTDLVPIMYLPLVTCTSNVDHAKKYHVFQKENKVIEVTAELIKPAYCPGDLCTVKMTTQNKSDIKITSVHLQMIAVVSTLAPNESSSESDISPYQHKQYTLLSETFFVSVPKNAVDHQDIFRFNLPSDIAPTFTNKMGKYIDIAYEVTITIPITGVTTGGASSWFQSSNPNLANIISLPITVATVPHDYPVDIELHDSDSELPAFIPNIDSPVPSPVQYPAESAYSVSPSGSFQMNNSDDLDSDHFDLNKPETLQDASGYLMVPESGRRKSSSSSSTDGIEVLRTETNNRSATVS
ncbi:hypothetical protein K501DRAFT_242275 [Backusella circina FSU 941]|nr:hypothetical protein K501DRAFT_242275 [Backusella circina FSU 941]